MNLECPVCHFSVSHVLRPGCCGVSLMAYEGDPLNGVIIESYFAMPCGHEVVYGYNDDNDPILHPIYGG